MSQAEEIALHFNFFSAVEQKINVDVEDMKMKNILKYRPSPEGEG